MRQIRERKKGQKHVRNGLTFNCTGSLNRWEVEEIILGNRVNIGLIHSTESSFQYWSALAGYTGEPIKTALPDTDPKDGKTIERYQFRETGKPEVTLLKVIGGKHDYPGDIDVHVEAWAFFKR